MLVFHIYGAGEEKVLRGPWCDPEIMVSWGGGDHELHIFYDIIRPQLEEMMKRELLSPTEKTLVQILIERLHFSADRGIMAAIMGMLGPGSDVALVWQVCVCGHSFIKKMKLS